MSSMAQSAPNTSWLDDELRKQKYIVSSLRDLVDQQQVIMTDQAQRIVALEERLTRLQGQLNRIPEVEEAQRHLRDQTGVLLSDLRQELQKREAESLRNRQVEREQDIRAIQAIQVELARFDPLEQGMAVRQAEDRRLAELITRTQQSLDELVARTNQREDRWRSLSDRIEQLNLRLNQVAESTEGQDRAFQEFTARILLVENAMAKLDQQMAELHMLRSELTKKQDEVAEYQRRADRERTQTMTEWGRRIEGFAHQLEQWSDQLRYFSDQHERNRRVLRDVQEVAQQASQQQDQLRQVQRITEEQLRRELREWRAETDRRLAQEVERREKLQEAQAELDDEQLKHLEALDEKLEQLASAMPVVHERIRALNDGLTNEITHLRRGHMLALKRQAKAFQDLVVELKGLFGEESS